MTNNITTITKNENATGKTVYSNLAWFYSRETGQRLAGI